jgi:hypothetical protein
MADLVAWSAIRVGEPTKNAENPGETKVIKPGETVTQDSLGLDDEQFRQLVESGAVRALEYPDIPNTYQDSPVNYLREQARIASEGALSDAQNSEENINAILAANQAATGTALQGDTLDPEVRAEMERQKEDQSSEPAPPAPTTSQVNPDQ